MIKAKIIYIALFLSVLISCNSKKEVGVKLKPHFYKTLSLLDSTLLTLQNRDTADADFGAVWCPHCGLYHTRAAEAVYPFAYQYFISGNAAFKDAAIRLGNWLIRQQFADGSWKETPEEWTGTTTDQLLMMLLAFDILKDDLSFNEQAVWNKSMKNAGNYLTENMSPRFASINYVATTTATLMVLYQLIPDEKYSKNARELARQTVSKMDDDYFITGEGGRVFDVKYGVDLTYNMEMSLWGLGLYAQISGDTLVYNRVKKSLIRHLNFIWPDGSIDGSWGIRSNKWTCFGGATSDGCQVLFSMFAGENDAYRTAAYRNLNYLQNCLVNGLVGYGPMHAEVFGSKPCIYPTFAKAKNLAMAHALLKSDTGALPDLPSDKNGLQVFPTLNIATLRTNNFRATVTAYGYKDKKGYKSKYMHRPTGGAISNLWLKGYGFLQAASQTEYHRWEPMHFPEAADIKCLTPRIEFVNSNGYFTNLYEFDATTNFKEAGGEITAAIYGELKDRELRQGGIGYSYNYIFSDNAVQKRVHLRFHDSKNRVEIIEPVIFYPGVKVEQIDEKTVSVKNSKVSLLFVLKSGNAELSVGKEKENYWSAYPALKAYPIVLTVIPDSTTIEQTIEYEFKLN